MSARTKALLALVTVAFLWGTAGVVAKTLLTVADPFVITFYRFAVAGLIILPFFLREHKPKRYLVELIPLSLLNSTNVFFFYIGLTTTTSNSAFLINAAAPLATALLSKTFIREEVSASKMFGVVTGLVGTTLIILLPMIEKGHALTGDLTGNMFILLGMLAWVLYAIGTRHVVGTGRYSPVVTTSMNIYVTTGVALFMALVSGKSLFVPRLLEVPYLPTLLFASLMITVTTFFLFQWAIKHVPATTASLKEYLQLVFAIGFNTVLLGERLTMGFLTGASLVLIGVGIATGQQLSAKLLSVLGGKTRRS